jgi:hypothetical protein
MTGCKPPLLAVHRLDGSLLLDLDYDQGSCAMPCATDNDCTTLSPACVSMTSTAASSGQSVCMVRHAAKGASCSLFAANEMCDLGLSRNMICADLGLSNAEQMSDRHVGVCVELCDAREMRCRARPDAQHEPACEYGFFSDMGVGICDDNCSAFPDDCVGPGSRPAAGNQARGMNCIPFPGSGTIDAPDQALCIDVAQKGAVFPIYDFQGAPSASCDTDVIACPHQTSCVSGDPFTTGSVCVYGCTTSRMPDGCDGTGHNTCRQVFGMTVQAGVCQ